MRRSLANLRSGTRPARYPCWKDPRPLRRARFTKTELDETFDMAYDFGKSAAERDENRAYVDGMIAGAQIGLEETSEREWESYLRGLQDGKRAPRDGEVGQ